MLGETQQKLVYYNWSIFRANQKRVSITLLELNMHKSRPMINDINCEYNSSYLSGRALSNFLDTNKLNNLSSRGGLEVERRPVSILA